MAEITVFQCSVCGRQYEAGEVEYTCPACGEVGTLDVRYDYSALRARVDRDALSGASMWRYRALLPLAAGSRVPPLAVGWTPLYDTPRLAESLGLGQIWVKDDGRNPTGSLKDRASAMVVAVADERGVQTLSAASTGNAAAALAGVCASVGRTPIIFVPASAPEAKIAQLLVYGATVLLVEGTYDQAFDLCMQLSVEQGWYCRNTGVNPFTVEGKKTVAFEMAEQLGWDVPDVVVVTVGDGNILAGVHKGFAELRELGWIERIPRLIGVQAEGSSPLVAAWQHDVLAADMQPVDAQTLADSISAGLPRDRSRALRAVRETGGAFVSVPDEAILAAIPALARATGVFAEPAASAALAGCQKAVEMGYIQPSERALLLITGSGLKDVRRAAQSVRGGLRVAANAEAVRAALKL